jgi:hypothetical protein
MTTSDIQQEDMRRIVEIHAASGFDYRFPKDFNTPLFPVKIAATHGPDLIAAAALKVEAEAYLWMDHDFGTPEMRMEALERLHRDLRERALKIGFDQVHCALPPEVAERFGERLETLGWKLARPWPIYVFQIR